MLELLKSLAMAVILVPIVMAIIMGLIYAFGELFNLISGVKDSPRS